jgi:RNA polymerase sigma-70 factor (ECF subfamily)
MVVTRPEKIAKNDLNEGLIRACQAGDREAFHVLYDCFKQKVYSLAVYMTGDAEFAKDLTQEIFVKIFRDIRGFRFESSFSSWLYRLSANTCLNALRNRRSRREVGIDDVSGTTADRAPDDPLEKHQTSARRNSVEQAILSLSPLLRAVVVLRYVDGLSYEEIAETLCCSEGTVASRLNRAHRVLERKLQSWRPLVTRGRV